MSLMKLNKENCKIIKYKKPKLIFSFHRYFPVASACFYDSAAVYLEAQKRAHEEMSKPLESITIDDIKCLFNHDKIKKYSESKDFIRFFTKNNMLMVHMHHPQCVSGFSEEIIGYGNKMLIDLIDQKISLDIWFKNTR